MQSAQETHVVRRERHRWCFCCRPFRSARLSVSGAGNGPPRSRVQAAVGLEGDGCEETVQRLPHPQMLKLDAAAGPLGARAAAQPVAVDLC